MRSFAPVRAYDEQASILLARGLQADKLAMIRELQLAGEFRLTSYAEFFRAADGNYRAGTTLAAVRRLYDFDHRLRSLCLEATGSIEVQVRSQLSYHFARRHGQYAYLDRNNFPNFSADQPGFLRWEGRIKDAIDSVRKDGVYPAEPRPATFAGSVPPFPIFIIAERMDFGTTLSFFNGVSSDIQKAVSDTVGVPDAVVISWLLGLRNLRNRCAHHHRVWNWSFRVGVKTPRRQKFPQWHSPKLPNHKIGILLTICRYWLNRIDPGNGWTERVFGLFDAYPELPAGAMGLPEHWRQHPLWVG